MTEEEIETHEEEEDGIPITYNKILESCREHKLYSVPELNDVLYLHYQGYTKIAALEKFTNLKSIWLNNNAITKIENISHLTQLTSLNLQNNYIEEITGLETLVNLTTLCLSNNYISKIENIDSLTKLETFEIDHNRVKTVELLQGILACPSIKILNMTHNMIEDENVIEVLAKLPNLTVLRLDCNPFVPKMRNYRRKIGIDLPQLNYLDDSPISAEDRRLFAAWLEGGKEAEMLERKKMKQEKRDREDADMRDFRRMQRNKLLEDGGNLKEHPELMSSDDEDKPRKVREISPEQLAREREQELAKAENVTASNSNQNSRVQIIIDDTAKKPSEATDELTAYEIKNLEDID